MTKVTKAVIDAKNARKISLAFGTVQGGAIQYAVLGGYIHFLGFLTHRMK